jgi:hypothetical protein
VIHTRPAPDLDGTSKTAASPVGSTCSPQAVPQGYLGRRNGNSTRARLAWRTESGWERLLSVLPAQLRSMAKPLALSARIPGGGFRVTTLLLFLLLRFHDLVPVIQRRLEWMLLGGMLEARG